MNVASLRTRATRLLGLVAPLLAACAPVVTHGPRVEPGATAVVTAGTYRPLCETECTGELIPMLGAGIRYGWVPDRPELPAVHAGLTLPVSDLAAPELDLYLQGPGRQGAWAYGAGVLTSPRHLMPYAQVGRTPEGGVGWYVTQGYAHILRYQGSWLDDEDGDSIPEYHRQPRYWSPAVTLRLPQETGSMDVYLAGAFGSYVENEVEYLYSPNGGGVAVTRVRRPVRMLMAGVSLNADLGAIGRAFPGFPARPPRRRQ